MVFSERTNWDSASNALSLLRQDKERSGEVIIDLTQSNPTQCGFSFYSSLELLKPFSDLKNLEYHPDPRGLLSAREAVCAYYAEHGIKIDPGQVFLTAGTSEAYGFIFRLLAEPGETIIAPRPSYPLFDFLAEIHDVELTADKAKENAKAIIFVNPNNPTGLYASRAQREWTRCPIIADEVFFDFRFDEKIERKSFAAQNTVLTFTLSGISKVLALPQMKLAWIVVTGPKAEREDACRRLEIISDTHLSVSTPIQNALPHWMTLRKKIQDEIRARCVENRKFLSTLIKPSEAQAGWCSVLPLKEGTDEEALVLKLLENENVLTHPGYFFDFEEGAHLVISHLLPVEIFREAVQKIKRYI